MRRLMHLAAWLYPRRWRARYGAELHSLIDDLSPGWADVVDLMRGGMGMRISTSNVGVMAVAVGLVGAGAAGGAAFVAPPQFESRGTIAATGVGDHDAAALGRDLQAALSAAAEAAFGGEEVPRAHIAVTRTSAPTAIQVSYLDPDPRRAQELTQRLMTGTIEANLRLAGQPAADPRAGTQLRIVDVANLPARPSRRNLGWMVSLGFGGGAILGAVIGVWRRRRKTM